MASLAWEKPRTGESGEIVHGTEDLMGMKEEWSDLLTESAADCVFLTWEWLTTWWRHLAGDRKLFVLAVRLRGRLLAIAPLVVRPAGISSVLPFPALEFMGTGSIGSDYLDVIVRRGQEASALKALAEGLAAANRAGELEQGRIGGSLAARLRKPPGDGGW